MKVYLRNQIAKYLIIENKKHEKGSENPVSRTSLSERLKNEPNLVKINYGGQENLRVPKAVSEMIQTTHSRAFVMYIIYMTLVLVTRNRMNIILSTYQMGFKKFPIFFSIIPLIINIIDSILFLIARSALMLCIRLISPFSPTSPPYLAPITIHNLLKIKTLVALTALKISPFIQIFFSFLSGYITEDYGIPGLVALCSLYPVIMGAIQKITAYTNSRYGMGLGLLVETYSLLFASLPYKLKWLSMNKNLMAFIVLGIKGAFKLIAYIAIPMTREIVNFYDRKNYSQKKLEAKLSKEEN